MHRIGPIAARAVRGGLPCPVGRAVVSEVVLVAQGVKPMSKTSKDYVAEADAAVERIDVETARRLIAEDGALVVDVREPPEVERTGRVAGAVNVSRGMLEFRADEASQHHDPEFRRDRPVIVYCASGGRSALSGKTLQEMGFERVYNLGGFSDWAEHGGAVEPAEKA